MKKLITNLTFALSIVAVALVAPVASADTVITTNPVEQCGNIQVEIKGFGAGLMYQPRPIAIAGEHVSTVSISEGCAVVSWVTDMPATSQVIFAELGSTINMDATKDNFGFVHASAQNNSAYVVHNAILNNLTPGKAYVYRVVSRSHPNAIATVSEARVVVIPKAPILPGPISIAPVIVVESVKSTVQNTTEKQVVITTADLLYYDTAEVEETATSSATSTELANVPAAITAVVDIDSKDGKAGGSFWTRLTQAFSFFSGGTAAKEVAKTATEGVTIDASGFVARVGFLVPTLFILLLIYLIQQIALPMLGIIVGRPLVFWMFSVIVVAIATGLLKYYQITLVMIAVFLGLLAWYLLSEAAEEVDHSSTTTTTTTTEVV